MSDALDFNRTLMKQGTASDAINTILDAALLAKRSTQERRAYLGASAVGESCERRVQFEFVGVPKEKDFKPDTLRKFDFGHMGEELAKGWFQAAGFKLTNINQRTGRPFGFEQLDGRFRGHVDGVFLDGPKVEGVGYPCLWETKSVGAKTFREIAKHGLKKSRPGYYSQVAVYAAYLELTAHPTIFTVTNLDSGEQIHLLIPFDGEEAQRMSDRAVRIIQAADAGDLLPRPFPNADYFECKWCSFAERCWSLPT